MTSSKLGRHILVLNASFLSLICHAHDGDLNPSFATNGWAAEVTASPSHRPAIAVAPDGHFFALTADAAREPSIDGWPLRSAQILLFKYSREGKLDTQFGDNGVIRLPYRAQSDDRLSLLLLPNKKMVIGGFVGNVPGVHIVRLDSSGAVDTSFGNNGLVTLYTPVEGSAGIGLTGDIALQPDGKLIVSYSTPWTYLARLQKDGQLDPDFGSNGTVNLSTSVHANDQVRKILVHGNNKITIAGDMYEPNVNNPYDFGIWKLNRDGSFDTSFATSGFRRYIVDGRIDRVGSALVDAHGRIIVAGGSSLPSNHDERFTLLRVLPNGDVDSSFGSNGFLYNEYGIGTRYYSVIDAFQPNGKFLAMGLSFVADGSGRNYGILLHRYNNDGSLDADFGNAGTAIYDVSGLQEFPHAMALTPDGHALIASLKEYPVTNYPGELATVYLSDLSLTQAIINDHDNDGAANAWPITPQAPSTKTSPQKLLSNSYAIAGLGDNIRVPVIAENALFDINASGELNADVRYVKNGDVLTFKTIDHSIDSNLHIGGLLASNNWQLALGQTQTVPVAATANTPPVIASGQVFTVDENDIAAVTVGIVAATDAENDPLTFTLSGSNSDKFVIEHDGTLKSKSKLDYEVAHSYTLTVIANDGLVNSAPVEIQIKINNMPEINLGNDVYPGGGFGSGSMHYFGFVLLLLIGTRRRFNSPIKRKISSGLELKCQLKTRK